MPKVSIIVRSYNDIEYIERTLQMINNQTFQDFELINVDSGSTDGTWEIVKQYNRKIAYQIKPSEYVPGRVLNKAIELSSGEIIVFNNSDCIPLHKEWLANLIKPLGGEGVAAVFGNQLPRPDARALIEKDHERAFGTGEISATWKHFFSLATSAVSADLIREKPFDNDVQYSEDIEWSWRMKNQGYKLIYVPDARVEHSHNYTIPEVFKRFHGEGVAEGKIYGEHMRCWKHFVKPMIVEIARDMVYLLKRGIIKEIPYSFVYRPVQKYAVYKGNKDYYDGLK